MRAPRLRSENTGSNAKVFEVHHGAAGSLANSGRSVVGHRGNAGHRTARQADRAAAVRGPVQQFHSLELPAPIKDHMIGEDLPQHGAAADSRTDAI